MEQGGQDLIGAFLPLIVLFAIFYFLIIRPQMKQQREHKAMLSSLDKGDVIITSGGLIGEIVKAEEEFIKVKLNDDVIVKVDRGFISRKIEEEA